MKQGSVAGESRIKAFLEQSQRFAKGICNMQVVTEDETVSRNVIPDKRLRNKS